ncbi:hypothetical protein GCM10010156_73960 [Planobispora rosea]|uniref:Uncharacterized protein n=1 Tax=Planobispora rosea TaxID=35762 RepID=A0A8J3WGW1_PLARO|nr:hypothetical protein [Planobispora rosea]GGT05472.1 hypothetical protein GCM10010156_73960 [Planobispora rosea]GIH88955.1 hypothetical protein Pro02_73630 [Planobispora rosea]
MNGDNRRPSTACTSADLEFLTLGATVGRSARPLEALGVVIDPREFAENILARTSGAPTRFLRQRPERWAGRCWSWPPISRPPSDLRPTCITGSSPVDTSDRCTRMQVGPVGPDILDHRPCEGATSGDLPS